MFVLDHPDGYPVGATSFSLQLENAISVGKAKLRSDPDKLALVAEQLAFTAYYPATSDLDTEQSNLKVEWLQRPLKQAWESYSHMLGLDGWRRWVIWPLVYLYGQFIKIPVHSSAPLRDNPQEKWPLVIFSHGLYGNRTAYSQICTRIAAQGAVVLAVEHHDGSAASCAPVEGRARHYYKSSDIFYDDHPEPDPDAIRFRGEQLSFRTHEMHAIYSAFRDFINNGTCQSLTTLDGTGVAPSGWKDKIQSNSLNLVGHSFGGCTVFSMLATPPPSNFANLNISKVIILDPWLDPLPELVLDMNPHISAPLLVVNSEPFTLWTEHYDRLKRLAQKWSNSEGTILTIAASEHISFSDYHLLPLIRVFKGNAPRQFMSTFATLCTAFLEENLDSELRKASTRKLEIVPAGKGTNEYGEPKRRLAGDLGDILID